MSCRRSQRHVGEEKEKEFDLHQKNELTVIIISACAKEIQILFSRTRRVTLYCISFVLGKKKLAKVKKKILFKQPLFRLFEAPPQALGMSQVEGRSKRR